MLIVYGTSERWCQRFGGTSKPEFPLQCFSRAVADINVHSFLVRDAQQESAGERLKA